MTEAARDRLLRTPLGLAMLGFGLPLAMGMGLQVTFNLVDAYLVSRLAAGEASAALGAIGICDQLAAIGSIICFGYTTAATTLMSHRQGAGDTLGARRVAWQSTLVVVALGIVFGAAGLFLSHWVMANVMGVRGLVLERGTQYLRVIVTGNITIFLLLHLTGLQRALGSSKTPIALLIASNAINLILAVVLVFGPDEAPAAFAFGPPLARWLHIPHMGLVGAAWATVISRLVVLVPVALIGVWRFDLFRKASRARFSSKLEKELWHLAWPASTQLVVRIAAMLVVQALVARRFTDDLDQAATTALGVVFRLETMALFIGLGWGSAAQTFVGHNLGANQIARAKNSGWIAAGYNSVMMALVAVVYVWHGRTIVGFFDGSPDVEQLASAYMHIVGPSYVGLGLSVVLGSAMQAAKQPLRSLILDLLVLVGLLIPAATVVSATAMSSDRVYWAIAAAYATFALLYVVAYRRLAFDNAVATRSSPSQGVVPQSGQLRPPAP